MTAVSFSYWWLHREWVLDPWLRGGEHLDALNLNLGKDSICKFVLLDGSSWCSETVRNLCLTSRRKAPKTYNQTVQYRPVKFHAWASREAPQRTWTGSTAWTDNAALINALSSSFLLPQRSACAEYPSVRANKCSVGRFLKIFCF